MMSTPMRDDVATKRIFRSIKDYLNGTLLEVYNYKDKLNKHK
jgi:hypothetical protein